MKTFTPTAQLQGLLEQMSRDMAVPVEGLVNQAIFNWAKLHGYVEPGSATVGVAIEAAPPPTSTVPAAHPLEPSVPKAAALPATKPAAKAPPEPETSPVPVVEEPSDGWKVISGGTFSAEKSEPELESTVPQMKKLRRLVLVLEDGEVEVEGPRFLIGREPTCNLMLDHPRVSRQHAVIHIGLQGAELQDLGSSNGTWFEGERIERRAIADGDEVKFGETPVRFEFR